MKIFNNKKYLRKIVVTLIIILLFNFAIPLQVRASDEDDSGDDAFGGKLFKPIFQFFASIGDVVEGALNHMMLGTKKMVSSSTLKASDDNIDEPERDLVCRYR